jgi:hypothetical protein
LPLPHFAALLCVLGADQRTGTQQRRVHIRKAKGKLMTLRDNYGMQQQEAARLLDLVRAGGFVSETQVSWALWVLGDLAE